MSLDRQFERWCHDERHLTFEEWRAERLASLQAMRLQRRAAKQFLRHTQNLWSTVYPAPRDWQQGAMQQARARLSALDNPFAGLFGGLP